MQALVKCAPGVGNVELRDMEEPKVSDGLVKIAVTNCGICGTDLHVFHDRFPNYPPVILGHEFSGVVTETGDNVDSVAVGDRVTVLPASAVTCGSCYYCRQGKFMFCRKRRGMGHGVSGAFTKFVVVRQDQVYKVPEGLSLDVAAVCEPFAAAVHAVVETARPNSGDVVLLSGPGPIGLMCLKLLVSQRLKVIVAGASSDELRLQFAKDIGAAVAVDTSQQDLLEVVNNETNGRGVDVAIECAGVGPSVRNCLSALRPEGILTQVGHFGFDIEVNYDTVAFKELRIRGAVGYTAATWDRALRILEEGQVELSDLITHRMKLSDWRQAFDICEQKQGLKVLLECDEVVGA